MESEESDDGGDQESDDGYEPSPKRRCSKRNKGKGVYLIFMAPLYLLVPTNSDPEKEDSMNTDDMDTSDYRPPSSATTTEPNKLQRRLDIASLCHPMEEVVGIRQPQEFTLFDKDLDAVHKPSWIKKETCECFSFFPERVC